MDGPRLDPLLGGFEDASLKFISSPDQDLGPVASDLRIAIGAEWCHHGPGMNRVRRDAAAPQPLPQLPHKHDHGELGGLSLI